jgi:hypothetical protein
LKTKKEKKSNSAPKSWKIVPVPIHQVHILTMAQLELYVGKNGLAWHYRKYSKDGLLQQLENTARKNKVGLWREENAIPAWEWRAKKK